MKSQNEALEALLQRLEATGLHLEAEAVSLVEQMYGKLSLGDLLALVQELVGRGGPLLPADKQRLFTAFEEARAEMGANAARFGTLLEESVTQGFTAGPAMLAAQGMVTDAFRLDPDLQREFVQGSLERFQKYWGAERQRFSEDIQENLLEAVNQGLGSDEAARRIADRVGVSRRRALLIATNELGNASAAAQQRSLTELGCTHYRWRTSQDRRVRPEHVKRNGRVYAWEEPPPGGHPGEAIRCRCVAIGLPPGTPVPDQGPEPMANPNLYEQIEVGQQLGALDTKLSRKATAQVLRGITRTGLGQYLRTPGKALGEVKMGTLPKDLMGQYDPLTKNLDLSVSRARGTYGTPWRAGKVATVSSSGKTRAEAMQRTLVHELGHHLVNVDDTQGIFQAALSAFQHPDARPISRRAAANWQEYWCESWTAFHYHRDSFKKYDPIGFKMVEDARAALGIDRKTP